MRLLAVLVLSAAVLAPVPALAAPSNTTLTCRNASSPASPGASRPVILVHGWNGDAASMDPVAAAIGVALGARAKVYTFDYHDRNGAWASDDKVAGCLATSVEALSAGSVKAGGDGRVYLVGHSMGGLAIRYAAARVGDRIGGVITLDTPHGGSFWGGTDRAAVMATTLGRVPRGLLEPVPPRDSDAARCLAPHLGGDTFPQRCGSAPPYLPKTAGLLQVAGQLSINRTLFGVPLYTVPADGDSIVDTSSQRGYVGSGPTTPAAYGPVLTTGIDCALDTAKLLGWAKDNAATLLPRLTEGIAGVGAEGAAGATGAGGATDPAAPGTAAVMAVADRLAACSHASMPRNPTALQATTDQLGAWFDAIENPPLAYTTDSGLAVVRGAAQVAAMGGRACGSLYSAYTPPVWTRDGRYATTVWTDCEDFSDGPPFIDDNLLFVIDTRTGTTRQVKCGCERAVALGEARIGWVDDYARTYVVDLAANTAPVVWTVRVPGGMFARSVIAGADGVVLLHATRTPTTRLGFEGRQESGAGAVVLARADGSVQVVRQFPSLAWVRVGAATARQFVYSPIESSGDCAHPGQIWLVDTDTGRETQTDAGALRGGDVFLRDAWWAPDGALHATLSSSVCDPSGGTQAIAPSLWRLDGNRWTKAGAGSVDYVRQYAAATRMTVAGGILWFERAGTRTQVAAGVRAVEAPASA